MKIAIANYEWPGVTANCGGGGAVSKALKNGLEAKGHAVRVVTDDSDGHFATFPARAYRRLSAAVKWADVAAGHFTVPTSLPLARLCERHNTPLAVSVMGADVYDPTRYRAIRPVLDTANRYIFSRADVVVTPSGDMTGRVAELGTQARTIHYGIDPSAWTWSYRERDGPLRLLTVCRLVERKNLAVARRAVRWLSSLNYDVEWRVVGTGPLSERVASWPEADARGYVDDLQGEHDWADVFFLPSKHEAFGMVFLEALASGLPVVTSETGGQTDIVESGEVGEYAAATPKAQGNAIRAVADNYEDYQINTCGYVKRNFSRGQMVDAYEKLFEELT